MQKETKNNEITSEKQNKNSQKRREERIYVKEKEKKTLFLLTLTQRP